jgi:hypothetical protein
MFDFLPSALTDTFNKYLIFCDEKDVQGMYGILKNTTYYCVGVSQKTCQDKKKRAEEKFTEGVEEEHFSGIFLLWSAPGLYTSLY